MAWLKSSEVLSLLKTTTRTAVASNMVWKSTPIASTPKLASWETLRGEKVPFFIPQRDLRVGEGFGQGLQSRRGVERCLVDDLVAGLKRGIQPESHAAVAAHRVATFQA